MSDYLRVPVGTIYQWRVRGGGPPAMRIGRYLRFDPDAVKAWSRGKLEAACDGQHRQEPSGHRLAGALA